MSVYGVAEFCRDCLTRPEVRALALNNPTRALQAYDITPDEHALLLAGDVGQLYQEGHYSFLLSYLPRWGIFGLNVSSYGESMRGASHPIKKA